MKTPPTPTAEKSARDSSLISMSPDGTLRRNIWDVMATADGIELLSSGSLLAAFLKEKP